MGPTAGAAGASSQANRGGSSGTSSSTIDQLEEVQITARRLDNNPTNTIRAGSEVPPDDLALLGSITVEGQRIRQGDDAGLDQWYFLNQYYRPHLTPQGQALVDDAGYAAEDNYRMLQRYGRYNVGALSTVSNTYDLLAGTSTGTGAANLAFGYNGGPASLAEKIIGTPIGLASGGLEGLFRGTAGAGNLRAMLLGPHSTK